MSVEATSCRLLSSVKMTELPHPCVSMNLPQFTEIPNRESVEATSGRLLSSVKMTELPHSLHFSRQRENAVFNVVSLSLPVYL